MQLKKIFSKRGMITVKNFLFFCIAYINYKVFPIKRKDIWLISERGNEARDNGYHLFKYLANERIIYKKNIFFIIDKNSKDYNKINKYDKYIIQYRSYKHWLYWLNSTKLISTHIDGCIPDITVYKFTKKFFNLKNKKNIFLQHGIIKDNLPQLYKRNANLDLFICGALPEYNYILKNYGYSNDVVKYTGLCRYDNLMEHKEKKQILLMPTFRMDLYINPDETLSEIYVKRFINSSYYKHYNDLINNTDLLEFLEKNDMKLIFYPHYELQKYLKFFNVKNDRIILANFSEFDVQTLLKESKVLITDYSSVFFDFMYMRKNVIFFQFDKSDYRKNHYSKGYFDYDTAGIGKVVEKEEDIIKELYLIKNRGYKLTDEESKTIDMYFKYNDKENCKRNYYEIRKL